MQPLEITTGLALLVGVVFVLWYTMRQGGPIANAWRFPAALSLAFGLFSIVTIAQEGILSVIPNHTQNLWGNQVWFDLLIGVGISWVFLSTEGRRLGMTILPWMVFVLATANIGLLAMLARVMYLKEKAANPA